MDDIEVDVGEVGVDEIGKKVQNSSKYKKTVRSLDFLTPKAKLAFIKLRQAFLKAMILHHFNPKRHIRIETDVSGYAMSGVLSQLTSDELLAIVETFKTWRYYLKGSRHEVLVLTDHNNLRQSMDMKSLSSKQVR